MSPIKTSVNICDNCILARRFKNEKSKTGVDEEQEQVLDGMVINFIIEYTAQISEFRHANANVKHVCMNK